MAQIDSQLLTLSNDVKNANVVKDLVLKKLNRDGLLSDKDYTEYLNKHQILIYNRSWFKKVLDRLSLRTNKNVYVYTFVKIDVSE